MMEPIGICARPDKPQVILKAGMDILSINRLAGKWLGYMNGRAVLASKDVNKVLSVLLASASIFSKKHENRVAYSCTAQLEDIDRFIRENVGLYDMYLIDNKPDEMQESRPVEARLPGCLTQIKTRMNAVAGNLDGLIHTANILLKTEPARDMWGGKQVREYLSGIRSAMVKINAEKENVDRQMELLSDAARFMQFAFNTKAVDKTAAAATTLIESFGQVKGFMSETAMALQKLAGVDKVFKDNTGYPATWFFMSSFLMDFMYEFEQLIQNLAGMANLETTTIEPVLIWKVSKK